MPPEDFKQYEEDTQTSTKNIKVNYEVVKPKKNRAYLYVIGAFVIGIIIGLILW